MIPSEDKVVTNIAFGGLELKTLYITESGLGRVVAMGWVRKGLELL